MTVQDIIDEVNTFIQDKSTLGSLDTNARIRAIDIAHDVLRSQIGFVDEESENNIFFTEDTNLYSLPTDFLEPISLRYYDDTFNVPPRWQYEKDYRLWRRANWKTTDTRRWSLYNGKGLRQIMLMGRNQKGANTLDSFNSLTGWTALNDTNATSLAIDTNIYKEGGASFSFNIIPTVTKRASLKKTFSAIDFTNYVNTAWFNIYIWISTTTGLSSFSFNWGSDSSNYYKVTVTSQADGSVFTAGAWNSLTFKWSSPTQVGTPNVKQITFYQLDFDYTASMPSSNAWRYDFLRAVFPDELILNYYSKNKGTNSGLSNITSYSAVTDIPSFSGKSEELKHSVAFMAASILDPSSRQDPTIWVNLNQIYVGEMKKRYPRKRITNISYIEGPDI